MSKRLFSKIRPGLFTPKFRNQEGKSIGSLINTNQSHPSDYNSHENSLAKNTNFESTASFRYQNKQGIVSTQEINIDYNFFL